MKKLLVSALAVLLLVTLLASCAQTGGEDVPTDSNGNTIVTDNPEDVPGFTAIGDTVYVNSQSGLNVRKTPNADSDSNKVGTLAYGKAVSRTGINEATGWSRIIFNGEAAYVKTEFLSSSEPAATTPAETETDVPDADFVACDETVYAYPTDNDKYVSDGKINLYSAPNRDKWTADVVAGTAMKRVGKTSEDNEGNGWSKLEYDGKTVYARNSVVTTTNPAGENTTAATTAAN